MGSVSIPVALDPHGNTVPIEEAVRHKTDYYRCPECNEIVNPRKGQKRAHYYAHKQGVLEEVNCSLSSQADVEDMVDDLRTPDIEEGERERQIRAYLGETHGQLNLFGVLPALEWDDLGLNQNVDDILNAMEIETSGILNPPVPSNFHPSEPEVLFDMDPDADAFRVEITGPGAPEKLTGEWTADGLRDGDLFLGDQGRARRHRENRQVKHGEWVYLVSDNPLRTTHEEASEYTLDSYTVLAFPARESTEHLLENQGSGLTTDQYGFEADVVLPPTAHPTAEAPIESPPESLVLVGVTPAQELDPVFEVVSIPKRDDDVVELEQTGTGNPRYYTTRVPHEGSRRVSVHQRNSSRHRMVHLHADRTTVRDEGEVPSREIGFEIEDADDTTRLSAVEGEVTHRFDSEFDAVQLPTMVEYVGPEGLEVDLTATFPAESAFDSRLRRHTTDPESLLPEIGQWVAQGCQRARFDFDGIGTITLEFAGNIAPGAQSQEVS